MAKVIIALGSNYHQSAHIQWASECLSALLGEIRFSGRLWTPDVKGTGRWYMNRLAAGITTLPATELEQVLKEIETASKRSKERVTIDLDLMQYDDRRYHERDWPRPYIQRLIPDLT